MRKLSNVKYAHSSRMLEEHKKELGIPLDYSGSIAIETWNIDNKELERKGVCVHSICDYLLGLGPFKEDNFGEEVEKIMTTLEIPENLSGQDISRFMIRKSLEKGYEMGTLTERRLWIEKFSKFSCIKNDQWFLDWISGLNGADKE